MRKKIFMLVMFTFLGTTTLLAMGRRLEGALNPTLLWEKEFPGSIIIDRNMKLARITGDVMVTVYPETREAEEIAGVYLFEKNGNEVHRWKKGFGTISDNGEIILFTSGPSGAPFHNRVHYSTRDGQELWNRRIGAEVYISPDGSLVVDASTAAESTQQIRVYDSNGEKIWTYKIAKDLYVKFSPDSNYLSVVGNNGVGGPGTVRLYDKSGHLLWTATQESTSIISFISQAASYTSVLDGSRLLHSGVIYDKEGNVTFEGAADISEDGGRLIVYTKDNISIYNLPEKAILKEFPIRFIRFSKFNPMCRSVAISYEGEYMAMLGKRTDTSSSKNFFVINTETNEIWETEIEPAGESESGFMQVFLTRDGKYMLVQAEGKLYYYQIY